MNAEQPKEEKKQEPQVVKEVHHHHYKHNMSADSVFVGFIIVVIGLVFLGRNAGWIPDNISFDWNWVWPLIIIFIGVSILSKNGWVSWLIGGIVTLVVLGVIAMMLFGGWDNKAATVTDTITIEKNTAVTSADIMLKTGAGKVTIKGDSDKLVSGTYEHRGLTLEQSDTTRDAKQFVELETTGSWNFWGSHANDFALSLANDVPLALHINSGATDLDLDLTSVTATEVDIDTGASDVTLVMGDKANLANISVDAGASSVTITLPKTVGAKLDLDSGATSKTLSDFVQRDNKTYESANYETATKKIMLDIDLGAANLLINWK